MFTLTLCGKARVIVCYFCSPIKSAQNQVKMEPSQQTQISVFGRLQTPRYTLLFYQSVMIVKHQPLLLCFIAFFTGHVCDYAFFTFSPIQKIKMFFSVFQFKLSQCKNASIFPRLADDKPLIVSLKFDTFL